MKIYCAHPINGLSYDEVLSYYTETSNLLKSHGYDVLCPMTGKEALRNEVSLKAEGYGFPISTNNAILGRDHWMVLQSDIVYLNLIGCKSISIGCMMELAFAFTHHKHTVLAMEKDNIHRHAFVLGSSNIIYETTKEAEDYLMKLSIGI